MLRASKDVVCVTRRREPATPASSAPCFSICSSLCLGVLLLFLLFLSLLSSPNLLPQAWPSFLSSLWTCSSPCLSLLCSLCSRCYLLSRPPWRSLSTCSSFCLPCRRHLQAGPPCGSSPPSPTSVRRKLGRGISSQERGGKAQGLCPAHICMQPAQSSWSGWAGSGVRSWSWAGSALQGRGGSCHPAVEAKPRGRGEDREGREGKGWRVPRPAHSWRQPPTRRPSLPPDVPRATGVLDALALAWIRGRRWLQHRGLIWDPAEGPRTLCLRHQDWTHSEIWN